MFFVHWCAQTVSIQGEIEGSILYQELLDNAWKFYNENLVKKQK